MFKIIYPSNDATLYEGKPTYNTGIDEILEVGKHLTVAVTSSHSLSRTLLKFDMADVNSALTKYTKTVNDCKFMLQLYTTHTKNLPASFTVDANVVGQDWTNGTGFFNSSTAIIDGCSWNQPGSGSISWISSSQNINMPTGSTLYVSGSGKGFDGINGKANDASGVNHGTVAGGLTSVADRNGVPNGAYMFDGASATITLDIPFPAADSDFSGQAFSAESSWD